VITVSRRARSHPDRGGDPLDGLVNLFDLGIVLALAFMLAALSSLKLSGLLTERDLTVVRSGKGESAVVVKRDQRVRAVELRAGERVAGQGRRVGSVYRLRDGRTIIVQGR
jgi:hypothetical protein